MDTFFKSLLPLLLLLALTAEGKTNLTGKNDPGFEQGTKYWNFFPKNSGAAFRKGKGIGNSSALVFASPLRTPAAQLNRKGFITVKPGEIYTLEARFRSRITAGHAALCARFWTGTKNGSQVRGSKLTGSVSSKITESMPRWSTVRCTFKIPEQVNGLHIGFEARGLVGEVVFDDVHLSRFSGKHELPLLDREPRLDGKLDPVFLKKAVRLADFVNFPAARKELAREQTEVYLAMTEQNICGQILLHHAKEDPLKKFPAKNDSKEFFKSESVEFFITYTGRQDPYYQIALNVCGNVFDSLGYSGRSWSSGVKTATGKISSTCSLITFVLPLKNIGYNHDLDKGLITPSWKINFSRNHKNPKHTRYSSWKSFRGSFHDVQNFDGFIGMGSRTGYTLSDRFHTNALSGNKTKDRQAAFWPVTQKEYQSLFSDKYSPFRGKSAFIWSHPISPRMMSFALQYGMVYSRESMFKEYEKGSLMPYATRESFDNYDQELMAYAQKTGNGIVLYFPYADMRGTFSCIYNPHTRKTLFNWTRNVLKNNPGCFWGISLGDEAAEHLTNRLVMALKDPKRVQKDPWLRAAAREIRTKYGYGKFGAPSSLSARERFNWIAVKKYVFAQLLEIQKELFKICGQFKRAGGQRLVSVSADPMGGLNVLQNQSREKDFCDIFTAQCLPPPSTQRQTIAFATKILKDLTGKVIWPAVHFEPYYHSHDTETTAAYLSEVARGGGTGLQIWNCDYVGKVRKMGCSEIDYYGHRPRWDTMLDIVNRFKTMPLLKFPRPDCAFYLSNETVLSYNKATFQDYEALFALLGPGAGSWFKFISGTQLLDQDCDLNKWKTVFVSKADIELPANQQKFLEYVQKGGTLICFDPRAFSYSPDGRETSAFREKLFGVKTIPSKEILFSFVPHAYTRNMPQGTVGMMPGWALKPLKGTEVLARFTDKNCAVSLKRYPNNGKAILFAAQMKFSSVGQKEWQQIIKQLLANEKIRTGHKIWNFSFPFKKEEPPVLKEKCCTNNYFYWYLNEPVTDGNIKLAGAGYQYNLPPEGTKQCRYSFAAGRLTNRLAALTAGDLACRTNRALIRSGKLKLEQFADIWTDEEPLKIDFSLGRKLPITRIAVYYTGCLPQLSAVFPDGKVYSVKGKTVSGVEKLELKFPANTAGKLQLVIDQRTLGEKLILSEVEIFCGSK